MGGTNRIDLILPVSEVAKMQPERKQGDQKTTNNFEMLLSQEIAKRNRSSFNNIEEPKEEKSVNNADANVSLASSLQASFAIMNRLLDSSKKKDKNK